MSKLETKAATEQAAKTVMVARREPTAAPTVEPYAGCPRINATSIVRAQFHVGVVVQGLSQTSLHRDGTNGGANKCQLWEVDRGVYIHFLNGKTGDLLIPWSNVEFVQLTDHRA